MVKVSATKLRKHLFDYLDRANAGEVVIIQRNNRDVARLMPITMEWREQMTIVPQLLVSPDELIEPFSNPSSNLTLPNP